MPPNVTNSVTNEQQVRSKKGLINGKANEKQNVSNESIKNEQKPDTTAKTKQSILSKIINFLFYLSIFLMVFVAAFIFIPWEDYFFEEGEIENYIDMYSDKQNGDWVLRQFLATSEQNITEPMLHEVKCHEPSYKMERAFNAAPQTCGLVMTDELMSKDEVARLRRLAENITEEIGYQSYANRESINLKWMNLHKLFRLHKEKKFSLKRKDFELIKKASENAKALISDAFGLPYDKLGFYMVTQFTRYRQVTPFSEFRHVDKVRSPALVVTSILWLSTCDVDFGGGRTEFLTGGPEPFTPLMIEPKLGRFAAWTSGHENPHGVMGLNWGDRLALIFAFSVNPNASYKTLDDMRTYAEQAKDFEY